MSSVNLASDSLLSWSQKDEAFLQKTKFEIEKICNSPKGDQLRIGDSRIKANVMIDQVHKLAYCRHGKVFFFKEIKSFDLAQSKYCPSTGGHHYFYGAFC